MSGDVFGNGMLLSRHIRLIAAFNHRHVFLDPNPDPRGELRRAQAAVRAAALGLERLRPVADLRGRRRVSAHARSRSRSRAQVREALGIEADGADARRADPRDPARRRSTCSGTAASAPTSRPPTETHADAGDKANDAVRRRRRGAALPGRRRGRQPRLHPARPDRVRARGRPDQHRRDRQRRRGQLLRPRGQHQDPARRARRRRRHDREAAQRAAGRDDRRGRRAGAVRQLHADPGAEPRARAGGADGRRPRAADPPARAGRGSGPRDRVPAQRRGDHRAQGGPPGAGRARAGGGDGVLQDPPATPQLLESDLPEDPYLGHDLERYFPPPLPERYAEQMRGAPAAPRDHRDRRRQPARRPRRARRSRSGSARRPARRRRSSRARTRSAREIFDMRSFWSAVEALDNEVEAQIQLDDADRGPPAGRARDALAGARHPGAIDIARTIRLLRAGSARCSRAALPGVLDGADRCGVRRPGRRARARRRAGGLGGRVAGMPSMLVGVRHRRGRADTATASRRGHDGIYFRLGSRLELNWLRDRIIELPRSEPLAGAGARGAAGRPVQPAPGAHPGGARGRRSESGRGGDRGLGAAQPRRASSAASRSSTTSRPRATTTRRRCRSRCGRCAT